MRVALVALVALGAVGAATLPVLGGQPLVLIEIPALAGLVQSSPSHHAHHAHGGQSAPHAGHEAAHDAHSAHADAPSSHQGHAEAASGTAHASHPATPAGDPHHEQLGMQRPAFPPANGTLPTSTAGMKRLSSLFIQGDGQLKGDAISGGSGTLSDPYVIRGIHFTGELNLRDTDACIRILENWIAGQLTLNWNGQCVWVHHNVIGDLRVNENVKRTGYATGGLMEQNKIGFIGQLRHYDGEFRHNVVGPRPPSMYDAVLETVPYDFLVDTRVANVDGFNQGLIRHNTFHGTVDLDFHGHHHGTGFFAPHSHYHGTETGRQNEHRHDHTQRWTSVAFTDNVILDPDGYGLRYEDQAHAGDDRRATSEGMDVLNDPHVHYTDIVLARNTVVGGKIWVDVFNADDINHKQRNPGTLTVADNVVELHERPPNRTACGILGFGPNFDPWSAIHVAMAKQVETRITGNQVTFVRQPEPPLTSVEGLKAEAEEAARECGLWPDDTRVSAIRLDQVRDARVVITGNQAQDVAIGVRATRMDDATTWRVVGNDFGKAAEPILYDKTVANPPETA
jgi:hypothetical protein